MYKPVLFVFCNMWNINNFRRYFVWEMHTAVGSFMWTGLLLCTNSIVSHRTQISNQVRIYSEVSWQYCSSEKMEVGQDIVNTNCSTAVVRKYIESVHESLFMIYLWVVKLAGYLCKTMFEIECLTWPSVFCICLYVTYCYLRSEAAQGETISHKSLLAPTLHFVTFAFQKNDDYNK